MIEVHHFENRSETREQLLVEIWIITEIWAHFRPLWSFDALFWISDFWKGSSLSEITTRRAGQEKIVHQALVIRKHMLLVYGCCLLPVILVCVWWVVLISPHNWGYLDVSPFPKIYHEPINQCRKSQKDTSSDLKGYMSHVRESCERYIWSQIHHFGYSAPFRNI